jgi:hypothetical protein
MAAPLLELRGAASHLDLFGQPAIPNGIFQHAGPMGKSHIRSTVID